MTTFWAYLQDVAGWITEYSLVTLVEFGATLGLLYYFAERMFAARGSNQKAAATATRRAPARRRRHAGAGGRHGAGGGLGQDLVTPCLVFRAPLAARVGGRELAPLGLGSSLAQKQALWNTLNLAVKITHATCHVGRTLADGEYGRVLITQRPRGSLANIILSRAHHQPRVPLQPAKRLFNNRKLLDPQTLQGM
ncbi:MAG: hypothetical protein AAF471_08720 [Myxococcota bacterium]